MGPETSAAAGSQSIVPNVGRAGFGGVAAPTRRGLLAWSGWATMGLIGLQAAAAFLVYFWPRKRGAFGTRISAGSPSDYQVDAVRYFVDGKFYLVRLEAGFLALYQRCPHLGCTVPWVPQEQREYEGTTVRGLFHCPCHGSTYLRNGQVIKGPAPRSMDIMRIALVNGRLVVDTGAIQKRDAWHPDQALKVE
jgi:cytochrome b6-f complex iron-sulfur subunit